LILFFLIKSERNFKYIEGKYFFMNEHREISEEVTEFRLSKGKILLNLLKLIPKMKKIRKKAEEIILTHNYY